MRTLSFKGESRTSAKQLLGWSESLGFSAMFWKHLANPVWLVREKAGEHKYVNVANSTLRETKKQLGFTSQLSGEGSGTPLQYSCLENPPDGEAWQAAVHGVTKSQTRLSDFTFTFHFHALEKDMATHSSVLAWRIPRDGGAWWAAGDGVAQSRTRLKRLSCSSSGAIYKIDKQ